MHTRDIAIAPDEEVKNKEEHFDYSEPFVQAREFEQSRKQEMHASAIGKDTTCCENLCRCREFMEINEVALIELLSESAIQKLSQPVSLSRRVEAISARIHVKF